MRTSPLLLLRDTKAFRKLCSKLDKDFGCKKRGCENCPLIIGQRVEWLVNNKGMSLGESYNASIRRKE